MRFSIAPDEPRGLLLSGGALQIAGVLTTIAAPTLAGALESSAGLSPARIGLSLTALHTVQVLVIFGLAASGLVERIDRRVSGLSGCLLAALALFAVGLTDNRDLMLAGMAVVGFGVGMAYSAGGSALSFANRTERAYSVVTIASIFVGSGLLLVTPWLRASATGVYAGFAVMLVVLGLLALAMPRLRPSANAPDVTATPSDGTAPPDVPRPSIGAAEEPDGRPDIVTAAQAEPRGTTSAWAWLGLAGMALVGAYFLINVGILAVWTFAGQIGEAAGFTSDASVVFLGATQLLSVLGCSIAWWLGKRPGKVAVLIAALVALAVGKAMVGSAVLWAYVVGMLGTNLCFYLVIPFVFAAGADLNPRSGRLVVTVGASAMVAGAVAPLMGGVIAGESGWLRLSLTAGALILASIPLAVYAVRAAQRRFAADHRVPEPAVAQ